MTSITGRLTIQTDNVGKVHEGHQDGQGWQRETEKGMGKNSSTMICLEQVL